MEEQDGVVQRLVYRVMCVLIPSKISFIPSILFPQVND